MTMDLEEKLMEINIIQARKTLLEMEFAISQKNYVTAASNMELQKTGSWQTDWHKVHLDLDSVVEQAERMTSPLTADFSMAPASMPWAGWKAFSRQS